MIVSNTMFIFFFSSRRRHTRSLCDWSSDVCSSDLHKIPKGRKKKFICNSQIIYYISVSITSQSTMMMTRGLIESCKSELDEIDIHRPRDLIKNSSKSGELPELPEGNK